MIIEQVYKKFITQDDCTKLLEKIYWQGVPTCPYCLSVNATQIFGESRYHCNSCNTSYSVTVGTIFHKTKIDLQKWFLAILLMNNSGECIGPRQLARELEVNKNTAMSMLAKIRDAVRQENKSILNIAEAIKKSVGAVH